jgi:hypothetical protein
MALVPKYPRSDVDLRQDTFKESVGLAVRYANLDFNEGGIPAGAGPLLRRLELNMCVNWRQLLKWNRHRIVLFLKTHQQQFRDCLEWLAADCVVDYRGRFSNPETYDESEWAEQWATEPAVQFLQLHGIEHVKLKLVPGFGEGQYFDELQIKQGECRDPLDRLCWYLLDGLNKNRRVYLQKCRYYKCGKFFFQPTKRKLFCSDLCRAQQAKVLKRFACGSLEQFRESNAAYMRAYNQRPDVKRRAGRKKRPYHRRDAASRS